MKRISFTIIWAIILLLFISVSGGGAKKKLAGAMESQPPTNISLGPYDCETIADCKKFCENFPGSLPICVKHICGCVGLSSNGVAKKTLTH
ncbi:unnamed protein product [Lactuca virosa]|uniref:Uncharacterized protein n=1 Tax=Lactuca virosa TaxID=75947 RepID=A0AAU9PDW8_9ASTR|nr:unnamed protein product [Lactuca virosa]